MTAQRISRRASIYGEALRRSARRSASGFTLLEVLVATAILGTAVAALFGLLSGSMGNLQRLRGPAQALMLAQSRMNELLTAGIAMGNGTTAPIPLDQRIEGRWDEHYRWEALATRYNAPPDILPGQTEMVRIALSVFWRPSPGKPEKEIAMETIQLRPEPPRTGQ